MKKIYSFLLLLFAFWQSANAQVVITEIMYNPPEAGTDTLEYLEIHNPGSSAVNLDGWKFSKGITYTFVGTSLPAGGYLVLAGKVSAVQSVLGIQNAIQWDMNQAFSNSGEALTLVDGSGALIDSVKYTNMAPWPDGNASGKSLTLCNPALDNTDPANWTAASSPMGVVVNGKDVFGNPGAGCATGTVLADDQVNIASGKPVVIDMLANDLIPGTTFVVSISQNPAHGTATLANNKITYQSTANYCGNDLIKYKVVNGAQTYEASIAVKVYCYPLYTIPQVHGEDATGKADSAAVFCELQGVVYGGNLVLDGLRFGLIDANNNGILINNDIATNFGYTVTEGDRVRCFGQIQQIAGVTRMELDTLIKVNSNNILVAALSIDSLDENTESRLVRSNKLLTLVDPQAWTTGVGPSGFTVKATDGAIVWDIRIDNDVDLWSMLPPTNPFYITGIGSQFDNTIPYLQQYQIFPRRASDIQEFVGTNDAQLGEKIALSPNPVFDVLNINSEVELEKITVISPSGQLVSAIEKPGFSQKLDVEKWTSGVYFIRFQQAGKSWTTRILKL